MMNNSMGEIISSLRKEKGMTQKELADKLGITDKAVSKWERNVSFPDTATIPKLAEILDVSVEELMNVKITPVSERRDMENMITLILKVIPLAMGVAVAVLSILDELPVNSGLSMLGIGLACVGIYLLNKKE